MRRLKVSKVESDSRAARAGVQEGDFLDAYDGNLLFETEALVSAVSTDGGLHVLRIIRDDKFVDLRCDSGRLGVSVVEVDLDDEAYGRALAAARETIVAAEDAKAKALREALNNIILTTAQRIDGYSSEVIEIITAECAFGMNYIRDLFVNVTDILGGRSKTTQNVLRDARRTCLDELRKEAVQLGADGVLAVDLDYSEFAAGGRSMLFLVASGTAVKLRREET